MHRAAQLVEGMDQGPDRVPQRHARAGVPHHRAHLFALALLVAVDRAVGAGRLGLAVGAFRQPPLGIAHQSRALVAQGLAAAAMVVGAEYAGHAHQGGVFAPEAAGEGFHAGKINGNRRVGN